MLPRISDDDEACTILALMHESFPVFVEWAFHNNAGQDTAYLSSNHIDAMTYHLEGCAMGLFKRLLITVPPRYFKSFCASVAFPAWRMGLDPKHKIMCVSYGDKPSTEFASGSRNLITAPDYKLAFPETTLADNSPIDMLRTTAGGYRMATSVTGAGTAFGCDTLIVDDLTKAGASSADRLKSIETFERTFMTRLDNKQEGVVIVVAQRTHIDDLPGYLLAKGGWTHLDLPAIAQKDSLIDIGQPTPFRRKKGDVLHPERENLETLAQIRNDIGDANYLAQYLGTPGAPEGAVILPQWFGRYEEPYPLHGYEYCVFVIDTALTPGTTSSWSVCSVFGVRGDTSHLLNVYRERVDFDRLTHDIERLIYEYRPTQVFVEWASNGPALISTLQKKWPHGILSMGWKLSKLERVSRALSFFQERKIKLPKKASWLSTWENEVFSFPSTMYDDQVDTLAYFAREAKAGFRNKASIEWNRTPPPGRLVAYS